MLEKEFDTTVLLVTRKPARTKTAVRVTPDAFQEVATKKAALHKVRYTFMTNVFPRNKKK